MGELACIERVRSIRAVSTAWLGTADEDTADEDTAVQNAPTLSDRSGLIFVVPHNSDPG